MWNVELLSTNHNIKYVRFRLLVFHDKNRVKWILYVFRGQVHDMTLIVMIIRCVFQYKFHYFSLYPTNDWFFIQFSYSYETRSDTSQFIPIQNWFFITIESEKGFAIWFVIYLLKNVIKVCFVYFSIVEFRFTKNRYHFIRMGSIEVKNVIQSANNKTKLKMKILEKWIRKILELCSSIYYFLSVPTKFNIWRMWKRIWKDICK